MGQRSRPSLCGYRIACHIAPCPLLIRLEVLEALDGLLWFGSGEEVSKRFSISQPTVSRYCRKALDLFGLTLDRQAGEWELLGDQNLLRLEREVHQLARGAGYRPLRLEATCWSAAALCADLTPAWMLGLSESVGVKRNLQLLKDRVVDCWLAGLPDLPASVQADLVSIQLARMPVFFTCAPGHPLLQRRHLDFFDIAPFPMLPLPVGFYPRIESSLKSIGLWNAGVPVARHRRDQWEGMAESGLMVGYGTPLSLRAGGGRLCRLPLNLPFDSGYSLIVHRDLLLHPLFNGLTDFLLARIRNLALEYPEIAVVYG